MLPFPLWYSYSFAMVLFAYHIGNSALSAVSEFIPRQAPVNFF